MESNGELSFAGSAFILPGPQVLERTTCSFVS
jgi:hypothetical protein